MGISARQSAPHPPAAAVDGAVDGGALDRHAQQMRRRSSRMTEATRVVPTGPRWHPTPDVEQKGRLVSELLSPLGRLERIKQQLGARKISVADVAWLCGQVYRQRVSLVIYGQH